MRDVLVQLLVSRTWNLKRDSCIKVGELSQAMRYRAVWHAVVADIPASDAEG